MSRFDADRSGVVPSRVPTFEEFVAEKIRTGQFNPVMPDPSGGGGGVTANDINGQLGPVVVGAPLAPAPQVAPPAFSSQPLPTPGSPMFQLGGSSDQLLTVPSGGYSQLPINPNIVNEVPDTGPQVRLAARESLIPDVLSRLASGGLQTVTGAGLPAQPPAIDYGIPDRTTGSLMQQLFPTGFDFSAPDPSAPDKAQLTFDPEAMYRAYLDQGMDPQTARDRVNAAVEAQLGPAQQTLDVGRDPNAHDDGTAGLLTKAGQLVDKTRQFSQGNESDALYNYITETEMTVDQAIAAGKAAPGTTPEMWQQYLDLTYGQGGVYGSDLMSVNVDPNNPGQLEYFSMYDRLDPAEKAQFKREFLDAYENGYSPTKKVLTDIGTWVDVPTGEFFKPGSEAGHEYIASTKSWWERAGADVAQDPASFLGVEKAPLEALASYGTRLAEREGATTAVKVVGNSINMFARAGKLPNAILNEAPDALIQAPIKSIAEAAAPYTDLFNTHIRGTAIKEGNSFIDAQHEATRAQQTAGGYEPPVPPEPVTIDPITGAPSTATLTTPPDLPGAGPSSASPSPGDRLNPFGAATPSKPSSVIPANPNQADIDDLNRQIQIRESMIEDGSLTGDDVASAQREIEDMKREVATLQGPTPEPVIPGNPQQGPLFIPERDALGNLVIPESDLPVWEPDPNKRPAWQEGLGPATGTVGPDAAEPLPIPFERITNELTQRRLELQQIDVRLGEFGNGKSPSFPEGFGPAQEPVGPNVTPEQLALQEQRDQVEQIVSDLEEVVAEIEQKAAPEPDVRFDDVPGYVEDAPADDDPLLLLEDNTNTIDDLTYELDDLKEELRMADPEDKADIREQIADVKQEIADAKKERKAIEKRIKDEAKQVAAKPVAPVESAPVPEQAAVQPAGASADPTDDGYVKWIADVKAGTINPFDPRVPRPDRLIDKVAQSDKWESFDALNAPKRSEAWDTDLYIQEDIDRLKEEARALPYEQGREMWAKQIHPRIIDQQLASMYHIVNDVVPDLKAVGADIGDIPITAERKSVPNKIIVDEATPGEITVAGGYNKSGTQQRRYIRQEPDGTYSVRKTDKAKTNLAEGLTTEKEAIDFANKELAEFPAKVSYQDDNLNYLIQRAVLRNEESVNDALRMRIGTSSVSPDPISGKDGEWFLRITPDQYDAIQQLRRELQINLGNTVVSANDVAEQWSVIKRRLLEQSSANLNDEENGILYRIASDANTYDEALKRLSGRTGDTLFGPSTKNLRKKIADDIQKAMTEGLANGDGQVVMFNSGPNPFGTRDRDPGAGKRAALDAAGKVFQAAPIGTASDQAEEIVNRRFRGGQYSGLRYQDVYEKVNLPKAKRDKQIAMQLFERGADADRLTREEIKDIRLKKKSKIVEIKAKSPAAGQMTIGGMQPNLRQRLTHSRRIEVNLPYGDLNDDQLLAVLQMEYGRYGDILTDTPEELATHRTATDIAESIDPTMKNQRRLAVDFLHMIVYRMPRTLLLADPLTAWTYTMRNVMSNWMMTTMDNPSWVFSGDGWKAVKGAYSDATIDKSIAAEMNAVLTGGHIPQELRSTVDKMSEILSREKTPVARALDDLWGRTPVLSKLGDAFDWKRGIDRGIERGMKIGTGYVPFLRMNVDSSILTISKEMEQYAMSRGMSIDQAGLFDRLWGLKDANGVFSRHDVYDSLYYQAVDLGYTEEMARKYAETASRRWQNLGKQAELDAVARIERVYPSNLNQTKLDHYLNYIAFFHFWPSRAAKFLLEEMIRHPQYALWWYRAHQGVARMAEEGEYPDAVKGLIKVSSGPLGLALYANPAAFFMVTSLLPAGPDLPDRQGTTWLGEHLTNIKQRTGTGPVPFIDAALNLIGIYGDSYMPDVFPSRTADLALATLDAALVASGHPPHSPVWDQTMENARETFSAMMPWANGGVPAGDASGYIQDVVGSMILQQNPDLWRRMSATEQYMDASGVMQTRPTADAAAAMEEYNAILDDEKDPRYTAAEKAVVYGNLFVKGLNLISPLSMRGKPIFRGESIQLANQGRDKKAEGLQPTPAESAQIGVRSIVTDSPASRDLKAERAQVQSFGTARQVTLADGYNQIAYDPITPGTVMVIGNDIYTWEDVMTMSQDDRKALADKWLIANHGLEDYKSYSEGKKALTDSLPSVSAYNDWAGNFRNDDGTINAAYRDRYMELSPGYKAYIDQLPAEVKANPADFDQKSVSQDAFLAASGESTSVYNKPFGDASDISAFRPDEIMGGGSSGGSSGGSKSSTDYETATSRLEKLNKSIAKYDKEMAEFDKKVMEITGGVPFDGLAPEWQASLARRLEREGIKTPSKPATVKNYEEWKALQEKSGLPSDKMTYIEWTIDQASALADEAAA